MDRNSSARWVNVFVGVWLFISAFIWPHTSAQLGNTWVIGVASVIFAAVATRVPNLRWANAVLAVWLFISVWALPTYTGTFWNNLIASIVMLIAALTPNTGAQLQATSAGAPGSSRTTAHPTSARH